MEENKKIFIECSCGTHVLKAESSIELFDGGKRYYQEVQLAMFTYGEHVPKKSLWDRIKYCFNHLRKGTIFSDQLCLSQDEAIKLANFLSEVTRVGQILETNKD